MAVSDMCSELTLLEESVASLAARAHAGPQHQITGRDLGLDSATQTAIGRALLGLLEDASSDVQTVSVKCLALLCRRMSSEQLLTIVDKLATLVCDSAKNESRDIYAIGIKTMCASVAVGNGAGGVGSAAAAGASAPPLMSSPSSTGVNMATRILLGMLAGLESNSKHAAQGAAQDANVVDVVTTVLDIIKEVLVKFGPHVPEVHQQLLQQITPVSNANAVVAARHCKRAHSCSCSLCFVCCTPPAPGVSSRQHSQAQHFNIGGVGSLSVRSIVPAVYGHHRGPIGSP